MSETKSKSMLYAQFSQKTMEASDYYNKHRSIIEKYKQLQEQFQKDLVQRVLAYSKKKSLTGTNIYGEEKEVDLQNYMLVKVIYHPEKDKIEVWYKGTWTDADTRELFLEPEDLDITP